MMRHSRFPKLSGITLVWALPFTLVTLASTLNAQQSSTGALTPERVDRNAYRILFRQALEYKKLADKVNASEDPKPDFNHLLAQRFGLNEDDNSSLLRLSVAYQSEIDPIHQQIVEVIQRFHARFPDMTIRPGIDASAPPELGSLQMQEDQVTLRYRDLLRNSMREDAYQAFHARLLQKFGNSLKVDSLSHEGGTS